MIKRKMLSALVTSIISTMIYASMFLPEILKKQLYGEIFEALLLTSLYIFPVVFLFGVPISMLIERLVERSEKKKILSMFLHIMMGLLFIFVVGLFLYPTQFLTDFRTFYLLNRIFFQAALFISFLFWLIDFILRGCSKRGVFSLF